MTTIADFFVGLVAALQALFLILEMLFWDKFFVKHDSDHKPESADAVKSAADLKALGANQGLYNGFLAAGLVWGLLTLDATGTSIKVFFLICVIVAGVFGGFTVDRKILLVQAIPGAVALALVLLS